MKTLVHHLLNPEGDTPKQDKEGSSTVKVDEAEFIKLKTDIEALRQRVEEAENETFKLDPKSPTFTDIQKIESLVQSILENRLSEFLGKPEKFTKDNILLCDTLINTLDIFRHVKLQVDSLKHMRFSVFFRK